MPHSPKRPCRYPGCPNLCDSGVYCEEHRKEWGHDALRGGAAFRGYGRKWKAARDDFLKRHPLCILCYQEGRLTPATVVDHITPHRGDGALFWDEKNWQPLCEHHHNEKTGCGM